MMKSKVRLGKFSLVLFLIYGIVGFVLLVATVDNTPLFCSILAFCILIGAAAGIFAASWLTVDEKNVTVRCLLAKHRIALRDIHEVRLYKPDGQKTIFGSFGFLGYWGIFEDNAIGRYRAYYGHHVDTFLVVLNDGRQYVLGCLHPADMIRHIDTLKKNQNRG